MQTQCSICKHPQFAEMMAELKADHPRTQVSTKYNVSYAALSNCWNEHRPHDQEYEVAESIKRNKKQLNAALKAKPMDRMLVKDLEQRLSQLRSEQRALHQIRKEENPSERSGGEIPLTIESLDALIAKAPASVSDADAPIQHLTHMIERTIPQDQWKTVCAKFIEELKDFTAPSQVVQVTVKESVPC